MGIEIYESDRTQGPTVALACAAGTLIRNYFVSVVGEDGRRYNGQSVEHQLNNLDEFELLVDNKNNNFFEVKNGLLLPPANLLTYLLTYSLTHSLTYLLTVRLYF